MLAALYLTVLTLAVFGGLSPLLIVCADSRGSLLSSVTGDL